MALTQQPNPILARPSGRILLEIEFDTSFPITLTDNTTTTYHFDSKPMRVSTETLYPGGALGTVEFEQLLVSEPVLRFATPNDFGGVQQVDQISFALSNSDGRFNAYLARPGGCRGTSVRAHAFDKNSGELQLDIARCEIATWNRGLRQVTFTATASGFAKLLDKLPISRLDSDFVEAPANISSGRPFPLGIGVGERVPALFAAQRDDYDDWILATGNCGIDVLWENDGQFGTDPLMYEIRHREYRRGGRFATAVRFWGGGPNTLTASIQRVYPDADEMVVDEWKWKGDFHGAMARMDAVAGSWAKDGSNNPLISTIDTGACVAGHSGVGLGALLLDGSSYLQVPFSDRFKVSTFTIDLWFRPQGYSATMADWVMGPYRDRAAASGSWLLGWDGANQRCRFRVGSTDYYTPTDSVARRKWSLVTVVHDGANSNLRIYVNGVEVTNTSPAALTWAATATPLTFGLNGSNPPNYAIGRLGYVRFSSCARTRREARRAYYLGRRNPVELIREIVEQEWGDATDPPSAGSPYTNSFDTAAATVDAIGDGVIKADGFVTELSDSRGVLDQLLTLRDMRLQRGEYGAVTLDVAQAATQIEARFSHEAPWANIAEIGGNAPVSLAEAAHILTFAYRVAGGSSAPSAQLALPVGRIADPVSMFFLWDHLAMDAVGKFKADRMRVRDQALRLGLLHEGRNLRPRQIIGVSIAAMGISGNYELLSADKTARATNVLAVPYDESIFTWTPPHYGAVVLTDRPIGYWRLNESAGPDALDSSGNGYDAVYSEGVFYDVLGALNHDPDGAVRFTAQSEAYVRVPNVTDGAFDFANRAPFSYECWVRPHGESGNGYLISKIAHLYLNAGSIAFERYTNAFIADQLAVDAWSHVVVTYDGTNVTIYVNGAAIAGPFSDTQNLIVDQTRYLTFGRDANEATAGSVLEGDLDEVAVYDYALSSARVLAHYNAGIGEPRPTPTDLQVDSRPKLKVGNAPRLRATDEYGQGSSEQFGPDDVWTCSAGPSVGPPGVPGGFSMEIELIENHDLPILGDGAVRDWTTTAQPRYVQILQDDGDTSYIESAGTSHGGPYTQGILFRVGQVKNPIGPIKGVGAYITGRSTDGGGSAAMYFGLGGARGSGQSPDDSFGATYSRKRTITEYSAFGPNAFQRQIGWGLTEVNGLQIGLIRVAAYTNVRVTKLEFFAESINREALGLGFARVYRVGPYPVGTEPPAPAIDDPTGTLIDGLKFVSGPIPESGAGNIFWYWAHVFDELGRYVVTVGPLRVNAVAA